MDAKLNYYQVNYYQRNKEKIKQYVQENYERTQEKRGWKYVCICHHCWIFVGGVLWPVRWENTRLCVVLTSFCFNRKPFKTCGHSFKCIRDVFCIEVAF